MALAAHDMTDRLEQLTALTRRLTELMVIETEALKARELDASSKDWEEKENLAHTYRIEMTELTRNPDSILSVPIELRRSLFEATRRFQEVLADHAKALNAMKEISEGLVEAIAKDLAAETAGPASYGATGMNQKTGTSSGFAINAKA